MRRSIMACVDCCHFLLAWAECGVVVDAREVHVWSNCMRGVQYAMFWFFSRILLFVGFVDLWWRPVVFERAKHTKKVVQCSKHCLHYLYFTVRWLCWITLYHIHVDLSPVPLFILQNTSCTIQNCIHIFWIPFHCFCCLCCHSLINSSLTLHGSCLSLVVRARSVTPEIDNFR